MFNNFNLPTKAKFVQVNDFFVNRFPSLGPTQAQYF